MNSELSEEILGLQNGDHLCLFYERDPAEQFPVLVPFIQDALVQDEQFVYVADDQTIEQLTAQLEHNGIHVAGETTRGRLKLWTRGQWRQPGPLDVEHKSRQIRGHMNEAFSAGFKGVRFGVEMTWTLGPNLDLAQLTYWEATLNRIFVPSVCARIMCQYNRSRFSPEVLAAALQTHPLAIVGGEVCTNPFYQAPLLLDRRSSTSPQPVPRLGEHVLTCASASSGHASNGNGAPADYLPERTSTPLVVPEKNDASGISSGAQVEWMLRQLQRGRAAEKQREELIAQRSALAEAEASHTRIQNILDSITDAFIALDANWRFLYVNKAAEKLLGKSSAALNGRSCWEEFPAIQGTEIEDQARRAVASPCSVAFEHFYPACNRWFSVNFYRAAAEGLSICFRDITEQKEAEKARLRLAAIVESSDDAIISKCLQGIINSWNRGAERMFGYSADEIIGKPISVLIPPQRENDEQAILSRIRRGERIEHYETVRRRKNGELLDISLTVSPLKDSHGQIIGASKIARDITDRKRAEAALRQSEMLFRQLADAMPQIVWAARSDGRIDYFNRRWYEFTGFSETDADENWNRIIHPDDCARAREALAAAVREGRLFESECRFQHRASGDFRWFLNRASPVRDAAGNVIRWFGSCTDIDCQKRSVEELEKAVADRTASLREAIAQLEEFSYTVSHDLRAPLRAMEGYSKVVLEDHADQLPDEAKQHLKRVIDNATRLDKMILDLLTFSRLASGDLRLERVCLDKLIRDLVEHYPRMQLPYADIQVLPLHDVIGHEPSLTQALSNLLSNAVKFVAPGTLPRIRLWTELQHPHVTVWIQDNGIGIDPKFQHRLFRMFERVHPTQSYEGTGVGLAIVRKAVERIGGKVGLESDGVNGSTFWVQLRAAD